MKVGDYVRTKDGDMGKIKENGGEIIKYCVGTLYGIDFDRNCLDREVLKSSPNIIDLIEIGDYVNGYEVTSKDQFLGFGNHDWYMTNDEIKSIVTKEQFESIKYEVN